MLTMCTRSEHRVIAVGYVDQCNMMVVIPTNLSCALTTPCVTHMQLLTHILLENFVFNLDCAFSLTSKRQDNITLINHQSTLFGVSSFHMAHMTLPQAQTHYRVSQLGH
jgi:hypothetical protein